MHPPPTAKIQIQKFKLRRQNLFILLFENKMWQAVPFQAPFPSCDPLYMPNQVWHAPNPFSFPQWPHYPQLTVPTDNDIIYQVQPTIISEAKEAESPTSKDDGRKKNRGKKGEYISSLNFKPLFMFI
jgi:hypothetical protein